MLFFFLRGVCVRALDASLSSQFFSLAMSWFEEPIVPVRLLPFVNSTICCKRVIIIQSSLLLSFVKCVLINFICSLIILPVSLSYSGD